ncbi:triosephosphate isomerase [Jeotgalicoccus coquinae]|jgi:triosephosphate isomerase|uniref:Triosephosphate isomerase n=1 Tax=Jeotgalicoccus coquinae TaxID=709509 RepID=A0A6V7RM28_9STAP|nr:triose-phosphate isomerase [Jeotgalicoccus coquinae]MBB6422306.1 triosephosphate isomerase [Jeotgalicoccus coquinae]GGE16952.1 triosephosphate isomerase [Jeotgalicoccus coquinae]CAD2078995.1 Triosephosphate isomerase [Jeotgalicoccus coquinae]
MRTPLIAGNWKMNMTVSEAGAFADELLKNTLNESVEAAICAPFIDLPVLIEKLKETNIKIGAQNVYYEQSGAFTGEISAPMLKDLGAHYVIAGHSERRELFGESDSDVNKKAHAVIEAGMVPIICVGETEEERDSGRHTAKVAGQVKAALEGIAAEAAGELVIAYEPIWAIGTGKSATSDDANAMCTSIRTEVEKLYDKGIADSVRILYGGSVKPATIEDLMSKSDVDGALVGGASLKTDDYTALVSGAAR